jgi:hypothetical protein
MHQDSTLKHTPRVYAKCDIVFVVSVKTRSLDHQRQWYFSWRSTAIIHSIFFGFVEVHRNGSNSQFLVYRNSGTTSKRWPGIHTHGRPGSPEMDNWDCLISASRRPVLSIKENGGLKRPGPRSLHTIRSLLSSPIGNFLSLSPKLSSARQQCHRHICGSTFVRASFLARMSRLWRSCLEGIYLLSSWGPLNSLNQRRWKV